MISWWISPNIYRSLEVSGPEFCGIDMYRQLFSSVAEMMDPETLSELLGEQITAVSTSPLFAQYNKSGSRLSRIELNRGHGPNLILKQVSSATDWLMRATNDKNIRALTLWEQGLLDLLPAEIDHATIACARDDNGGAILLRDVSDQMLAYVRFSQANNAFMLEAMAALHASFFESPHLSSQELGLCRLADVYGMFSPLTGEREAGGADEVPQRILQGWELVKTAVPADVASIILTLLDDPAPLCDALGRYPQTLVHGDWRHANQGLERNRKARLILLDWQLATAAPPAVELGRSLGTNSVLLPVSKEEAIEYYKIQLARRLGPRFDESWWKPQLALGLLGGFLQDGWAIVLKATHWHVGAGAREHWQADLAWWSDQVRAGKQWL